MADYSGYFMQGLSEGLTSGVNLGLTYLEIREKRKQKKLLQEKETKLQEASIKWNTATTKAYEDGRISDIELSDMTTLFLGFSAEFQESHRRAMDNITKGNTDAFDQDMKFYNMWIKETEDLSKIGNISSLYEEYTPYFTTQKGKDLIEANAMSKKRRAEAMKAQPPEAPKISDEKTVLDRLIENSVLPKSVYNSILQSYVNRGFDVSIYTHDVAKSLRETVGKLNLYNTPEEVLANVKAPAGSGLMVVPARDSATGKYYGGFQKKTTTPTGGGFRATSLSEQEKYIQRALGANTLEDKNKVIDTYGNAGYDTSEMPTDQEWIDGKLAELDSHVEMLKEITDENGRLIGDKQFNFMSGDKAENKTGSEWYKAIYEAYMFYLEELRKMGIDVSKYPKIRPPKETEKVGFLKGMFTTGGVERGYPSIYYTETTPAPTETPKLPSL